MYGAHILLRARDSSTMDIMIGEYCRLIGQWANANHLESVANEGNVKVIVTHIQRTFGYTGTCWNGSVGDQAGFGGGLGTTQLTWSYAYTRPPTNHFQRTARVHAHPLPPPSA